MKPKSEIVTASWFTELPETHAPIGISRGVPRGRSGYRRYTALQPGPWFSSASTEEFTKLYNEEILGVLDPERVFNDLLEMANGGNPALLCWEPSEPGPTWCHRSLVSVWLWERVGLEVPELGLEPEGLGWRHPKLHPDVRRPNEARTRAGAPAGG